MLCLPSRLTRNSTQTQLKISLYGRLLQLTWNPSTSGGRGSRIQSWSPALVMLRSFSENKNKKPGCRSNSGPWVQLEKECSRVSKTREPVEILLRRTLPSPPLLSPPQGGEGSHPSPLGTRSSAVLMTPEPQACRENQVRLIPPLL